MKDTLNRARDWAAGTYERTSRSTARAHQRAYHRIENCVMRPFINPIFLWPEVYFRPVFWETPTAKREQFQYQWLNTLIGCLIVTLAGLLGFFALLALLVAASAARSPAFWTSPLFWEVLALVLVLYIGIGILTWMLSSVWKAAFRAGARVMRESPMRDFARD